MKLKDLKIGDGVFCHCSSGHGQGGPDNVEKISYKYDENTGDKYAVIHISGNHQFDSRTGDALTPPTAYYIEPYEG